MKCCVPLCRSTGDNHPTTVPIHDGQEGITYNRFPTSPGQQAAWLQMLGLTENDLPPGAVVCSQHFKRNDFTVMNDGTVKLMENSIPLQFCMICLATGNSKMYPMNQNYLEKAYTTITGIAVSYIRDKINTLPRLCAECAQRLVNCDHLRDKSLRAYKSLMQIIHNDKVLTSHNLKSVDRVRKRLTSHLLKHTFEADSYDLYVKYNEEDIKIHVKEESYSDIEENTEIKREKCDNSEKDEKEFLKESEDLQNDVLATNGISNGDNLNCDNINNDDSPNRDISDFRLNHNVVQVINKDKFDKNITNNEFMINNSDDEVKSVEDDIINDFENRRGNSINQNNVVLSKNKHGKTLNRLKVRNKSKNRAILRNVVFVKDSKPIILNKILMPKIDKAKENPQFPKVHYSKAKRKNIKNAQTKEKNTEKSPENVIILNNKLPGVIQEDESEKNDEKLFKTRVSKANKPNLIEKLFTKTLLTYEEQLAEIRSRQDAEHYSSYPYKCDICFTGRWSLFTYNRHLDKHTDKFGKLECAICGFRYKSRTWLVRHVRAHAERFSCKRCDFVSGTRSLVRLHARWHSGVAFACPHCDHKFRKSSTYFTHIRLKHPSAFACPLCGYCFVSESGVKFHIKFSHPSETLQNLPGPSCEQCYIRFASQAAYDTHLSVSSKHVIPGIFQRNQPTNKYQENRKGRPQGKRTSKHLTIKQSKLCEVCGKYFQSVTLLNQHMNVHAGVRPYKCDVCTRSYFSKFSLRYHVQLSHSSSSRRYPCGVCHREFSFCSNLQRHMLTHNPKRPRYTCDICKKSFTTLAGKTSHVAHVHNHVPRPTRLRTYTRTRTRTGTRSDARDAGVAP